MDPNFARISRNLPQPKFRKTLRETLAQGKPQWQADVRPNERKGGVSRPAAPPLPPRPRGLVRNKREPPSDFNMALDSADLAATTEPLYAYNPSGKGAKKLLQRLRLEQGESITTFVKQALETLPRQPATVGLEEPEVELLKCTSEAARLVVWLGALASPIAEKYTYTVAQRCFTLRQYVLAAQISATTVRSLQEQAAAARGAKGKSPSSMMPAVEWMAIEGPTGPWQLAFPAGVDSPVSCELAMSAVCVHLRAVDALHSAAEGDGSSVQWRVRMAEAVPAAIEWLKALVALQKSAAGSSEPQLGAKENAKPAAAAQVGKGPASGVPPSLENAYHRISHVVKVLRTARACSEPTLAAWQAEIAQLVGRPVDSAANAAPAPLPPPAASSKKAASSGAASESGGPASSATRQPTPSAAKAAVDDESKIYAAAAEQLVPNAGVQAGGVQAGGVAGGGGGGAATPARGGAPATPGRPAMTPSRGDGPPPGCTPGRPAARATFDPVACEAAGRFLSRLPPAASLARLDGSLSTCNALSVPYAGCPHSGCSVPPASPARSYLLYPAFCRARWLPCPRNLTPSLLPLSASPSRPLLPPVVAAGCVSSTFST